MEQHKCSKSIPVKVICSWKQGGLVTTEGKNISKLNHKYLPSPPGSQEHVMEHTNTISNDVANRN